jgi:hypothetical protein
MEFMAHIEYEQRDDGVILRRNIKNKGCGHLEIEGVEGLRQQITLPSMVWRIKTDER